MDIHDQILLFIKANGPTTPTKVAKAIKQESLFASALLADLASHRKIRISHLKIGGSPLYYLPEQEEQLYNFTQGNINPKDHVVLERLKAEKILRESSLELLPKVALRGLKDFAIPLQVTTANGTELFWKWHLLSKEEANEIIGNILNPKANEPEPLEEIRPISEAPTPEQAQAAITQTQETPVATPSPTQEIEQEPESVDQIPTIEAQTIEEEEPEEPKQQEKDVPKIADLQKEHEEKKPIKEEKEEPESKNETKESTTQKEEQTQLADRKPLIERLREKIAGKKKEVADKLLEMIEPNFEEDKIEIVSYEIVRKNSEIDLTILVPTVVGKAKFFCKAKKKARLDDKDIAAAYLEAQAKKLPLLMIHTGTLSKKAQDMLDQENFVNLCMRKVE